MRTAALPVLVLLLVAGTVPASVAQTRSTSQAEAARLTAHAVSNSISIDGVLDEADWQSASFADAFRQYEPSEGDEPTQTTEVRVLYGSNALYIGAMLHDDAPGQIMRTLGRRDFVNQADWFVVSIDSYFDRKTAYVFAVSAAGVQFDGIRSGSGRGGGGGGGGIRGVDRSWDAVWASSARIGAGGWAVEMRIPYSMLRFPEAGNQTWGIHFERHMPRRGEQVQWPLVRRAERFNRVANFGLLEGLRGISPRRNVQVQPYTVSRLQTEESAEQSGKRVREGNLDVGGDLKIGLSSSITLDATINPDFGQVEADPAELNLTAFETFFREQRPFFVEGTQIFQFSIGQGGPGGGGNLLYTRRMGAQAPIIGAAKLSGRTAGGLSFGVLGTSTGDDFKPARHYGVARVSQQIHSFSSVGGILTGFDGAEADGGLRSLAGAADWDLRFMGNAYSLAGFASFTRRGGEEQASPETGVAASARAAKRQGSFRYDLTASLFDERFDPNDVGRLRRNNYVSIDGGLDHEVNGSQPFGPFLRGFIGVNTGQQWSYDDGLNLGADMWMFSRWTTRSFQGLGLDLSVENPFGGYDLFETRGLWPRALPGAVQVGGEFQTDERRAWQVGPELGVTFQENGGREYELRVSANWNVGSRLSLFGDVEAEWEDDVIAWSSNEPFMRGVRGWMIGSGNSPPDELNSGDYVFFDDEGLLGGILDAAEPFGADGRYFVPVFGARDTRSLDFTVRSTVTFTPRFSLQFYGQLFLARGRYDDFQILRDRDTLLPFDPFPKRDDFAFSNVQANTVLRWEYRPGSVLYLVWTQGRRAEDELNPLAPWGASPYNTPMGRQVADAFDIIPSNVFLIKLNYVFLR